MAQRSDRDSGGEIKVTLSARIEQVCAHAPGENARRARICGYDESGLGGDDGLRVDGSLARRCARAVRRDGGTRARVQTGEVNDACLRHPVLNRAYGGAYFGNHAGLHDAALNQRERFGLRQSRQRRAILQHPGHIRKE